MKELNKKSVLIVDDIVSDRSELKKILSSDYRVLEAQNGDKALAMLGRSEDGICAVILAFGACGEDCARVLKALRENEEFSSVSVILAAPAEDAERQEQALELGADDLVTKPYNAGVVRRRVQNIITRTEAVMKVDENKHLMELLRFLEIDAKTGIYTKGRFCSATEEKLLQEPEKRFLIVRWDVDHFKLYNDAYGTVSGDNYLSKIGEMYKTRISGLSKVVTYGHWDADHFVMCCEKDGFE